MSRPTLDVDVPPPGGFCDDCGHYAARHVGRRCTWPQYPCTCTGLLWRGVRYEIDRTRGPVAVIETDDTPPTLGLRNGP